MAWDDDERAALVALLRSRPKGMTFADVVAEVGPRASAVAVWNELHPPALYGEAQELLDARADMEAWRADGLGFLTFLDDGYPDQLRGVHDLPPVLFHRGRLIAHDRAVSLVGSRAASPVGLSIAETLARGLVDRDVTAVSGLAQGIDTAVHRATLDTGGRTVAVIGTGIRRCYPAENQALQDEVAERGLLLSQFWPDASPTKLSFPLRNATMSGYGRVTVVVEAGEHSGARIQARVAIAHGRPVVLVDQVVAANVWAQRLVGQPGVHVARSTADVMRLVDEIMTDPDRIDALLAPATGWG